jgi:hypothetical protein
MTCKNNLCNNRCVSPWACGWKDNYSQGATVENGVETPLPITLIEPKVSRRWLWKVAIVAGLMLATAVGVWLK